MEINSRFTAAQEIYPTSSFLLVALFTSSSEEEIKTLTENFVKKYSSYVSSDLMDKIIHLKNIYGANFESDLTPIDLLSKLKTYKLESIFPDVMVALTLFCTLPITVASVEKAFNTLSRVQHFLRAFSTPGRMSDLENLSIKAPLVRKLNFDAFIKNFSEEEKSL